MQPDTTKPALPEPVALIDPRALARGAASMHCISRPEYRSAADVDVGVEYVPVYTQAAIDAAVGDLQFGYDFYKRRCDALQAWQSRMRDPERIVVCDILANGFTLDPPGKRYDIPDAAVAEARAVPEWPCACDEQGRGEPGVTCGDCPRDYGHCVTPSPTPVEQPDGPRKKIGKPLVEHKCEFEPEVDDE